MTSHYITSGYFSADQIWGGGGGGGGGDLHRPSDRSTNTEHLEHFKEDLTKAPFQLQQLMPKEYKS